MRRCLLTVAVCLVVGLGLSGTALAGGLTQVLPPLPGGGQSVTGGDQTAQQTNTSSVEQTQGNGNVNISPAIALFGDASTKNAQGNGNTAVALVDQSNSADQSQTAQQSGSSQSGSTPCGCEQGKPYSQGEPASQTADGGDQTAQQSNSSSVEQKQGNGNVNISPAIALFGDASSKNAQGNGNTAVALVDQSNSADQSQTAQQSGSSQSGSTPCGCEQGKPYSQGEPASQTADGGDQTAQQSNSSSVEQKQGNGNVNISPAIALFGDASSKNAQGNGNEAGAAVVQSNDADQSQSAQQNGGSGGSQTADGGDQTAQQSNSSSVEQKQGNGNWNVSPAVSIGGGKPMAKPERYGKKDGPHGKDDGGASTSNYQGNGNTAVALVDQSNSAEQSQSAHQTAKSDCGCKSRWSKSKDSNAPQTADGGDQTAQQSNSSSVEQKQGNKNWNISPALTLGGGKPAPAPYERMKGGSKTDDGPHGSTGASTSSAQGNGNHAVALVHQSNEVWQSQTVWQSSHGTCGCSRW